MIFPSFEDCRGPALNARVLWHVCLGSLGLILCSCICDHEHSLDRFMFFYMFLWLFNFHLFLFRSITIKMESGPTLHRGVEGPIWSVGLSASRIEPSTRRVLAMQGMDTIEYQLSPRRVL